MAVVAFGPFPLNKLHSINFGQIHKFILQGPLKMQFIGSNTLKKFVLTLLWYLLVNSAEYGHYHI